MGDERDGGLDGGAIAVLSTGPPSGGEDGPPVVRAEPWRPGRKLVAGSVIVAILLATIGVGTWALIYRQTYRPLALFNNDNATGATHVNNRFGQTGQWYAPYRAHETFLFAFDIGNNGNRAVTVDRLEVAPFNLVQGPVTVDSSEFPQQVAPAADRRPMTGTAIPGHGDTTFVVPLRYICDPKRGVGDLEILEQIRVTYGFWGVHHTVWLELPQPEIFTGGEACRP